jgi:hypothetical protein
MSESGPGPVVGDRISLDIGEAESPPTVRNVNHLTTDIPELVCDASGCTVRPSSGCEIVTIDKVSFTRVNALVQKIYTDPTMLRSTALDILAIYLKGQKMLYTESKTFCEMRLNTLMLPAIATTAACTVLSIVLKEWAGGATLVACLNAFNSFLLAVVAYLKLDAKAEAHKTSAYKYDKLQAYCEFKSGKILFFQDLLTNKDAIREIIEYVESQVTDVKETNQFLIPESIRYALPTIYGTNVFAVVKKIQYEEMVLVNGLKRVINELISVHTDASVPLTRKLELEAQQNDQIEKIIRLRDYYVTLDRSFREEVDHRMRRTRWNPCCIQWLNT